MKLVFSIVIIKCFLAILCLPLASFAQEEAANGSISIAARDNYRVRQGDKLSIKFFYQPELNEISLTVRPDGFISLQLIDDFRVEGKTAAEIKQQLEKAYEEILVQPMITVAILEFVAPHVFIGGQVAKPGRYDLRDAQTLVQVIFLAGGFTPDANRKMVVRARPDGKGDWQIQSANVMKILNQKGVEKDLTLEDGDYIFIPESKISQITKAVEGFKGLLPRFF